MKKVKRSSQKATPIKIFYIENVVVKKNSIPTHVMSPFDAPLDAITDGSQFYRPLRAGILSFDGDNSAGLCTWTLLGGDLPKKNNQYFVRGYIYNPGIDQNLDVKIDTRLTLEVFCVPE